MLAPLPSLHRLILVFATLVVGLAVGAWLGLVPEVPVRVGAGLLAGAGLGLLVAFVLVHDFHHPEEQPVRLRRRSH